MLYGCVSSFNPVNYMAVDHSRFHTVNHKIIDSQRTIYLSYHSASAQKFAIKKQLRNAFIKLGYRVMAQPGQAYFILKVKVRFLGYQHNGSVPVVVSDIGLQVNSPKVDNCVLIKAHVSLTGKKNMTLAEAKPKLKDAFVQSIITLFK